MSKRDPSIHDPKDSDMHYRELQDAADEGLVPLKSLDPGAVGDFDEMLAAMADTAFGGRRMGQAAEVLEAMITDPECAVVLTLSGAMTVAKMGLVITEMVERGWVQAIVSTGALMTHGLVELAGMEHYRAEGEVDDKALFDKGYNRVYDTYEMEKNLNAVQALMVAAYEAMPTDRRWASYELCREAGRMLERPGARGIMAACHRAGVPIYIPAFTDSELGLDMAAWMINRRRTETGERVLDILRDLRSPYDPFLDLGHYNALVNAAPRLGIFTIGGGVPRNWAQQAPPFIDLVTVVVGERMRLNRFRYGVRICPEPVHWGGLSGCTYSEGVSWGKFLPPDEGGRFAEVHADATIVWPILVKAVSQRLERNSWPAVSPEIALPGF